jgi:succinate-semialdehyde dehydrogenase/glutarate-semialdehyde dehydrogenase
MSYVDGHWVQSANGATYAVTNPFNGEVIAHVPDCDGEDTNRAIDAAETAFHQWKQKTAGERANILRRWFDLMILHKNDLGKILTAEQGKPLKEAIGEIVYGASFIEWFAEEARRTYGDVIPGHAVDKRIITIKQPIGVVAAIAPWNFPNAMITRKAGPALAAGCTVVLKPAEQTPLSALALAQLGEEAGIPPGVFNVITTNHPEVVGEALTANPKVKKLSFTGSTQVGKILIKACADTVKKVSMELGGNAPFIVFPDADIDEAVEGAIVSKYRNAGQTCVCSNRIFVHESIFDEFSDKLTRATGKLKSGDGFDEEVVIGPMIDEKALQSVEDLIDDAKSKGAEIKIGGDRSSANPNVFEPTVMVDVNTSMNVFHEEIFGPIAPVFKFNSEEEVIALANDTPFGLAAYFYGRDYAGYKRKQK